MHALRMTITNSTWEALDVIHPLISQLFYGQGDCRPVTVRRVNIVAPEPFGEHGTLRDYYLDIAFRNGNLFGSIHVWVLLEATNEEDNRRSWRPTRLKVISHGTGPGEGKSFVFIDGMLELDKTPEADVAWQTADKRRIGYTS